MFRVKQAGAHVADSTRFALPRVGRRDASRRLRWVEGPDTVMSGELQTSDPDAFARLLARGIGRHRAFGFGMLLLRPA